MPSPEHGPTGPSEQPRQPEQEPVPYHRTVRFADGQSASDAYAAVQDAIFAGPPNDLSAYRFLLDQVSHIAVLGEPPPAQLDDQLQALLSVGEPATLPRGVLLALVERRRRLSRQGSWLEGHYRPGRPLDPGP